MDSKDDGPSRMSIRLSSPNQQRYAEAPLVVVPREGTEAQICEATFRVASITLCP